MDRLKDQINRLAIENSPERIQLLLDKKTQYLSHLQKKYVLYRQRDKVPESLRDLSDLELQSLISEHTCFQKVYDKIYGPGFNLSELPREAQIHLYMRIQSLNECTSQNLGRVYLLGKDAYYHLYLIRIGKEYFIYETMDKLYPIYRQGEDWVSPDFPELQVLWGTRYSPQRCLDLYQEYKKVCDPIWDQDYPKDQIHKCKDLRIEHLKHCGYSLPHINAVLHLNK